MRINILILIIGLFVFPNLAFARTCGMLDQKELSECLGSEFSKSDKKMNKVYNELRSHLENDAKEMLKKAQQAWLTFRDNDCEFQASAAAGGQAYAPLFLSCQTKKTVYRTKELKESGW